MGRTIKLILYYLAYQLGFIFLLTAIDAFIAQAKGIEVTFDFQASTLALSIGVLLSASAMTWHLIHFDYVKFNKESFKEVSKKVILLSLPLLISAQYLSGILNEALHLDDINQDLFVAMCHTVFGFLSITIVAPILEELLFRGVIEGHLLNKGWAPKWAILVSALIFGVIHGNPAQIPFAFLIGLLFGWLYYRTGSVLPGIAGHIINNLYGACTMITSTPEELNQTTLETFGPVLTYVLTIVAIVVFIGMLIYLNKHLPHHQILSENQSMN